MSNENPNFVNDLVAMAMAFKELPAVREELSAAKAESDGKSETIARLEARLMQMKAELDSTYDAVRKAEEDRDEATRAFLEADDRTEKALGLVRSIVGDAQSLLRAVEPPKPEPIPEPKAVVHEVTVEVPGPLASESVGGQPGPISDGSPATSTGDVLSTTSPAPDGLFGATGECAMDPTPQTPPVAPTDTNTSPIGEVVGTISADAVATDSGESVPLADDVGYHNEPTYTVEGNDWYAQWQDWANRMTAKYGPNQWPSRTAALA